MSLAYIRQYYGVPARRGVLFRAWYRYRDTFRLALGPTRIRSGTNYLHPPRHGGFHPTDRIEYLHPQTQRRLWPVTDEEIERAGLRGAPLAPVHEEET